MKNYRTILLVTILTLTAFAWSEKTQAAAPANDNFANAMPLVLNGDSASVITNNIDATKEPGEANHAGNAGGKSVWFSFTPTETMVVRFNTMDMNIDSLMAIYTGSSVDNLQLVGYNDSYPGGGGASLANLMVVGGTTYYIAVDGYNAGAGDFRLVIFKPYITPYDNLEHTDNLGSYYTGQVSGTNYGATREPNEPNHFSANQPGLNSVWYRWTPSESFSVKFELTENYDSVLAVYSSDVPDPTFAQLTPVIQSYDLYGTHNASRYRVNFFARTGKRYFIAVAGYTSFGPYSEGNFQLRFSPNRLRYSTDYEVYNDNASISVFRPSDSTWYSLDQMVANPDYVKWGKNGDMPIPADYDGDGETDKAVTRNENGLKIWWIQNAPLSYAIQWGLASDRVSTGDFDADGRADLVAIRNNGQNLVWYVRQSSNGAMRAFTFGLPSDAPVAGDFDGDGYTDVAVIRSTQGGKVWHVLKSGFTFSYNQYSATQFGLASDMAAAEDFDGDGKTDVAVYRSSTGEWHILRSGSGQLQVTQFGASGDIPQPADYDGDGKADLGLFRPSEGNWYFWLSRTNTQKVIHWGVSGDIPVSSMHSLGL